MGCVAQVKVVDAPVVEQVVTLVEFSHQCAEPWTQRCPAFDGTDECLIPGRMSGGHRELRRLNDTSRLGDRDAAPQPEQEHQILRGLPPRIAGSFGQIVESLELRVDVRDEVGVEVGRDHAVPTPS